MIRWQRCVANSSRRSAQGAASPGGEVRRDQRTAMLCCRPGTSTEPREPFNRTVWRPRTKPKESRSAAGAWRSHNAYAPSSRSRRR